MEWKASHQEVKETENKIKNSKHHINKDQLMKYYTGSDSSIIWNIYWTIQIL